MKAPTTTGKESFELEVGIVVMDWVIREYGGFKAIKQGVSDWKALGFPLNKIENYLEFEAASIYKERRNDFVNERTFV